MGIAKKKISSLVAASVLAFGVSQGAAADERDDIISAAPDTVSAASAFAVSANPLMPVPLIAGMALIYGGFCVVAARRRMQGAWLRATAGAVLTTALINPEFLQQQQNNLPTDVLIVVDKSASQSLGMRGEQNAQMLERLTQELTGLDNTRIRIIEDDGSHGGRHDGSMSGGTNLFAALDDALVNVPRDSLGGVIMLTDGQVHDVPDDALSSGYHNIYEAQAQGVPFHALVAGHDDEFDRRIVVHNPPRFAKAGQETGLDFSIIEQGPVPAGIDRAEITVRLNGEEISRQQIDRSAFEQASVQFDLPERTGRHYIELEIGALDGELTAVNNRVTADIEAVRDDLNVLLFSGTPYQGTRVWRDFLGEHPNVNLVPFTILQPPAKQDATSLTDMALSPVPARELLIEELEEYDLIVFDRYEFLNVLPVQYFDSINDYVRNGGGLLVISGPEYRGGHKSLYNTPLRPVLPGAPDGSMSQQAYSPSITEQGQRHPVTRALTAQSGDWGSWFRQVRLEGTPNGHVVMEGAGAQPLLILNREEQGRVAMLQSDNAWLWARGLEGGGPYEELAGRTLGWLTQDPALEEEALFMHPAAGGDSGLVITRQTMDDTALAAHNTVTIHTPAGEQREITLTQIAPGRWQGVADRGSDDTHGVYRADMPDSREAGTVLQSYIHMPHENPREFENVLSTKEKLAPFVSETGGQVLRMEGRDGNVIRPQFVKADTVQPDSQRDGVLALRDRDALEMAESSRTPLLPPFATMLALVGLLAAYSFRESGRTLFRRQKVAGPQDKGPQENKTQGRAP